MNTHKHYILRYKISFFIVVAIILFIQNIYGQQTMSLEHAFRGSFFPETIQKIQWIENLEACSYIRNKTLYTKHISEPEVEIITLKSLSAKLQQTMWSFPEYMWLNSSHIRIYGNAAISDYSTLKDSLIFQHHTSKNAYGFIAHNQGNIAYIEQKNIHILTKNRDSIIITPPTDYYCSDSIYRNEFGYTQGKFWSNSGNKLLYIAKNDSKIKDYPSMKYSNTIPEINTYKYAFAGEDFESIQIGIYDLMRDTTIYLELPEQNCYYTNPTLNKQENKVYVFYVNRAQDSCALQEYNAQNGTFIQTIFTETHAKYVEPLFPIYFLNNDNELYFVSRRDGFQHMYSYSFSNQKISQHTKGNWEISSVLGIQADSCLYVTGNSSEHPCNQYIYSITKDSTYIIDERSGTHTAHIHNQKPLLIQYFNNITNAGEYTLVQTRTNKREIILQAHDPLKVYKTPRATFGTLHAADDSTLLHYRMLFPPDFSPRKKYPAIIHVYGGPHYQNVTNEWMCGFDLQSYILSAQGYIVFALDNRGSAYRGMEFESITHTQLGKIEMLDQKCGINYLKTLRYIDTDRIGVYGWSFGAFMAITLLANYPDDITVAVAGNPVIDWKFYEAMYGERYMNTPQENPEGYAETSLLTQAQNIQGSLLLIVGGSDIVTVPNQSMQFIEACNNAAKTIDVHIYPSQKHHMLGMQRYDVMKRIQTYFHTHLKN